MAKNSVSFSCSNCQHSSIKWLGCCPSCNEWNSFIEEKAHFSPVLGGKKTGTSRTATGELLPLKTLHEIEFSEQKRMLSGIAEWDNVLGGGIMPGSLLILTGDPGIGKSTLLLHVAHKLANNYSVFYFSSEESLEQVKNRPMRIDSIHDSLLFSDKANIEGIIHTSQERKPDIIIIDSIQNCFFSETQTFPGTVGQLRETSFALMRLAKEHGIAVIITCHITKEGHMAGPKTLEHMVDGVFYLQGEDRWHTRILRSVKNRFGALHELGFFSMTEKGMEEVPHINQFLLSESTAAAGAVLVSCLEGSRPLLLEIQALVVQSKFGVPQRVVTGLDHKRVVLIAAILEKYLFIKFSSQDIFVKVSGGIKLTESSSDLGIALALLSSYFQQALPEKSMALAEISLTGALKPINGIETQLKEAQKFGIKKIFVAAGQKTTSTSIKAFSSVYQLLSLFDDSPDQTIEQK